MIDSHTDSDSQLRHCLTVPHLAVATALMELPPDICSMISRHDGGLLLGAQSFQAVLALPGHTTITGNCFAVEAYAIVWQRRAHTI